MISSNIRQPFGSNWHRVPRIIWTSCPGFHQGRWSQNSGVYWWEESNLPSHADHWNGNSVGQQQLPTRKSIGLQEVGWGLLPVTHISHYNWADYSYIIHWLFNLYLTDFSFKSEINTIDLFGSSKPPWWLPPSNLRQQVTSGQVSNEINHILD